MWKTSMLIKGLTLQKENEYQNINIFKVLDNESEDEDIDIEYNVTSKVNKNIIDDENKRIIVYLDERY